ncbi:HAMP domain-containing protein [Alteromonas sp. K632G]|uniref:histidine kinase n=1 Tax=Alteromonas naphthalenivorans TaxID=715451 RepID=F5ZB97_ALTNA|nr:MULTISPECIES: ATP-binding protein [Alteromonas]AEF02690.1 periplasmic sensor signal transduction histidine kinase [Alteromonas naphthalenivorans]MBO7922988.1 HAMP domain-containing protein [Alteromonas sp. K632G]
MKLSHKLLVILVGFTCVSLSLSLALARWSFEQGFNEFIQNQERERLRSLSRVLIAEYSSNNNSWDNIQIESVAPTGMPHRRPGMRPRPGGFPPPRHQIEDVSAGPPTLLTNPSGDVVSGQASYEDENERNEVSVKLDFNGQIIGRLTSYPPKTPDSDVARAFSEQQLQAIIFIGLLSLIASLILALGVTPRMLSPFKAILQSVKGLTAHQYKTNLPENRPDEFGELMRHINTLGNTLGAHKNTKSQWLADISHELRTPLTILSGEIELIKAGIRPLDQKQLASFDQEVTRLSLLVEDLYQLSLSDIGGLSYHFSSVNLSQVIVQQSESLAHIFDTKGLTFTCSCPPNITINADHQRLKQLMLNLLVNACEYTDAPGTVEVVVSEQPSFIVIIVQDSAPSIAKENAAALFEPLFREDASRRRRTQGAGLGLSISKQIIEAHGGKISASVSSLGGVKITAELPKHFTTDNN